MYSPTKRAVIAISAAKADSNSFASISAALRAQGVETMLLSNFEDLVHMDGGAAKAASYALSKCDGVIVMGNNGDIDPAKYGQEKHEKTTIEDDPYRTAFEEALLTQALLQKKPTTVVCGGMQRLNVLLGGDLNQHVEGHHQGHLHGSIPSQVVGVQGGTLLAKLVANTGQQSDATGAPLPPGSFAENSFHHQAIGRLASGFRINAVSSDGVVQGFEADPSGPYKDQYIMATQWHPEFGASDLSRAVVKDLAAQSVAYAQAHPREESRMANMVESVLSAGNQMAAGEALRATPASAGRSWVDLAIASRRGNLSPSLGG